jgi:hypothetical protein
LSYTLHGNTAVVDLERRSSCATPTIHNKITCWLHCHRRSRLDLYPHLRLVPMPLGEVLYESGDILRHVYFPIDSIVSLLYVMKDGASAETMDASTGYARSLTGA